MRVFIVAMDCEAECLAPEHKMIVSGIGKVNAAAATQRAISEFGATEIYNFGVAGGFTGTKVGGLYEVESGVEYDFDLVQINGTKIGTLNERDSPYIPMKMKGMYPAKILASGDRFNDSEVDNHLIEHELGCGLRDMEGAAVAHICEKNGIPCYSLKCVTDVHGDKAMTGQYVENLKRCLAILKDALPAWIDK